eukprot:5691181-Prymnesium_polylepis.2
MEQRATWRGGAEEWGGWSAGRGVHERARRKVNGQGSPEAVLGHALGGCVRMSSYSYSDARRRTCGDACLLQ